MFAVSKCGKCGGGLFKLVTQEPTGSNFKINFVQCSGCNTPVGVMDYYNTGAQLQELKTASQNTSARLDSLEHTLRQILQAMRR